MSRAPNQSTVEFRELKDCPGYVVDSAGQMWSRRPRNGRGPLLDDWRKVRGAMRAGYLAIKLNGDNGPYTSIHKIVLETFVGKRKPGQCCRHLDGSPLNNSMENLCWGTPQENADDRAKHRRTQRGTTHYCAKLNPEAVRKIRSSKKTAVELAKELDVSDTAVRMARRCETWKEVT